LGQLEIIGIWVDPNQKGGVVNNSCGVDSHQKVGLYNLGPYAQNNDSFLQKEIKIGIIFTNYNVLED
jgi:hypothetical protein